MRVLVTGGAGYIGSHMVRTLLDAGHEVIVFDDLSTGHWDATPDGAVFIRASIDSERMRQQFRDNHAHTIEAVFHFAGAIQVGESVTDPALYYRRNTIQTLDLLDIILTARPTPAFIFSSTAAVYGHPIHSFDKLSFREDAPLNPSSPYGRSKLVIEQAIEDYGRAYNLSWAAMRYFNASGAWPEHCLGERHDPETHLIPLCLRAASNSTNLTLYGTKHPTLDGTCVRDFVHVRDLCTAHLLALDYLLDGGEPTAINLGTGRGHSVREVIQTVEQVTERRIEVREEAARPGDPPSLVANVDKAKALLGWTAKRSDLETIIRDAYAFESIQRLHRH